VSRYTRWTRLGLWRRLDQRLAFDWRLARGDEVLPSAVVADSRSLRPAPTAWVRGIDGGKLVKGVKLFAVCDKNRTPCGTPVAPVPFNVRRPFYALFVRCSACCRDSSRTALYLL
jgi:hypothetical protein